VIRRLRTTLVALVAAGAVLVPAVGGTLPAAADDLPAYHPGSLPGIGAAQQVVVVTAPSWGSTRGTLRAYERTADGWQVVVKATPALLGSRGLVPADERRQGTGKTPAGTFGIVSAFGRQADPGTELDYLRVDRDDAWTYHPDYPAIYNVLQTAPRPWTGFGRYVERLWSYGKQYNYVAVMDYNLPDGPIRTGADGVRRAATPADTRAGGGIFLHVSNGRTTAGCIAIEESVMRSVLRWLDPAKEPVIVVGPTAEIGRLSLIRDA
jgi:L,D-peptidoglycan transpeptidase YkuD (ErfK/YbiS/YcfS/YnhG family)